MNYIILIFFIFIIYSLGSALYYMMKDGGGSTRMVKALTIRVGVSIALFIFVLFSFWMEWIKPAGVT
ncbi:MAG: twin transmembrane helix small protein [Cocleimonas sp.]